jgi:hypothetical protein
MDTPALKQCPQFTDIAEGRFKWGRGGLCVVVVLRPGLPPLALLHYRDWLVCGLLGGVCEHLDR